MSSPPTQRVVVVAEEDDFEEQRQYLLEQIEAAKEAEEIALAISTAATKKKNDFLASLHSLLDSRENEIMERRMRELKENDAVKAYIMAVEEEKDKKKKSKKSSNAKVEGVESAEVSRKKEKIPCDNCGALVGRSHIARHKRETKSCLDFGK